MGKPVIAQRRGKGGPVFTAPSHLFKVDAVFRTYDEREREGVVRGQVVSLIDDPGHSALVMGVRLDDGSLHYFLAPEGIAVGDRIELGRDAALLPGSVLPLARIPDGAPVYNIELVPGDGGKLVRSAGSAAWVSGRIGDKVVITLPSRAVKVVDGACRAQLGVLSVGGRLEQPLMKAGKKFYIVRPTARYWPVVRGVAMSPYDHPFGGKEHHPGRPTVVARGAPPGAKVGLIAARRVGRRKGKKVSR